MGSVVGVGIRDSRLGWTGKYQGTTTSVMQYVGSPGDISGRIHDVHTDIIYKIEPSSVK